MAEYVSAMAVREGRYGNPYSRLRSDSEADCFARRR
jgi:hypothetical protein